MARAHRVHLRLTGRGRKRDKLAVAVGERNRIVVDQRQLAYAGARERFARERADTAHAEHGDMGRGERLDGLCAEQQLGAGKFM